MYLLYLDESGNEDDPKDKHFVLGGAAVFERTTFFLSQELDQIQTRHFPGIQPIPFHASNIRSGKDFWRPVAPRSRENVLKDIAAVMANANNPGVVFFAVVVEKDQYTYGEKAIELATEGVCRRFDTFLKQRELENSDPQRGLLIFSEGRFDKRAKLWVKRFRELGTRWGTLKNLSDIPYFASMRETRLLQAADFVAYSVFQLYERKDPSFISPFLQRFNEHSGTLHGLVHYKSYASKITPCDCPACASRYSPFNYGSWI